jgi:uncharacterized cupin superfamily protein
MRGRPGCEILGIVTRPGCVRVLELPEEQRPRFLKGATGIRATVRAVGDTAGLARMGVWLRTVQPGDAGTARHFHEVEEEWAYVLAGRGTARIGPHRVAVRAGSFVGFPPGPAPHHFLAEGDAPLVLLEGGERRPSEDAGWYVDLGIRWRAGKREETSDAPPRETGEPRQHVHLDELEAKTFQHPVEPEAQRVYKTLHAPAGLVRQAVKWSRVEPGRHSTAYHTHERTDEWIYVLSGSAIARVGDARFRVEAGDFLAHPAGGAPHTMIAETGLEYLMGGMIDSADVVTYPDARVRKRGGAFEPI